MLCPTKSPIKYAQMRGRGCRLCPEIGKEEFIIYDFVGNSKRFSDPGKAYQWSKPTVKEEIARKYGDFMTIPEGSLNDEIRTREIINGLDINHDKNQTHAIVDSPRRRHRPKRSRTLAKAKTSNISFIQEARPVSGEILSWANTSNEQWTEVGNNIFNILTDPTLSQDGQEKLQDIALEIATKLQERLVFGSDCQQCEKNRLKLRTSMLEVVLEKGVPRSYTPEMFEQKRNDMFLFFDDVYLNNEEDPLGQCSLQDVPLGVVISEGKAITLPNKENTTHYLDLSSRNEVNTARAPGSKAKVETLMSVAGLT